MALTYSPIATTTLGSAAANITFSSISSSYTDLIVVIQGSFSVNDMNYWVQFNGDTGNNYSHTIVYGNGTNALSNRAAGQNKILLAGSFYGGGTSATTPSIAQFSVMNYANSTTNKTTLSRGTTFRNDGNGEAGATVGLWRSTAAINQITILPYSGNLNSGTIATLYGVKAA